MTFRTYVEKCFVIRLPNKSYRDIRRKKAIKHKNDINTYNGVVYLLKHSFLLNIQVARILRLEQVIKWILFARNFLFEQETNKANANSSLFSSM